MCFKEVLAWPGAGMDARDSTLAKNLLSHSQSNMVKEEEFPENLLVRSFRILGVFYTLSKRETQDE